MNFVFDIGNVLIDFKPMPFLEGLFPDPLLRDKMYETVFQSPEWEEMDRGTVTHEEATAVFCGRESGFEREIRHTMQHLKDMLTPISDTVAWLPEIKEAGHGLYYLSNIHRELRDYVVRQYPFFSLFDGGVFSCDVHMIKPAADIYLHLLERYALDPGTCLFFDDMEANIEAAHREGIRGVLFRDAACVEPFLRE